MWSLFYFIYISVNSWYLNQPDEDWYWPVQISQLNSISRCLISPCKSRLDGNVFNYMFTIIASVTPFKIDQNKNQNRSIDKVQNLGNERRYIYKDPRQDSGQTDILYTRYPKKCFTQTCRDLYGDAMLVLTWMS